MRKAKFKEIIEIILDVIGHSKGIMERRYGCLCKALAKKTANKGVINTYLNLEYQARREWIAGVATESRVRGLFEKYPCFNMFI